MMLLGLAGHGHRRAPYNLNYREMYCSRGAVCFASVAYVSRPVHVLISPYLMNVLRPRLQAAETSPDPSLDLLSFVLPFLFYRPLVYGG
jgi:hypothetical protein